MEIRYSSNQRAVSYTHLDVYKRQVAGCGKGLSDAECADGKLPGADCDLCIQNGPHQQSIQLFHSNRPFQLTHQYRAAGNRQYDLQTVDGKQPVVGGILWTQQ